MPQSISEMYYDAHKQETIIVNKIYKFRPKKKGAEEGCIPCPYLNSWATMVEEDELPQVIEIVI